MIKNNEIAITHNFNCPYIYDNDKQTTVLAIFNLEYHPKHPITYECYNEKECKAMNHEKSMSRTITWPQFCYFYNNWQELNLPLDSSNE